MAKFQRAKLSPRLENGTVCWYAGDTFSLNLRLELKTPEGEEFHLGQNETLQIRILDPRGTQLHQQTWTATQMTGDTLTLQVDQTLSAAMGPGVYGLDLRLLGEQTTTLLHKAPMIVE